MTPKEKAKELVNRFLSPIKEYPKEGNIYYKECALICVDEMLDIRNSLYVNEGSLVQEYLLEVKKEIEAL